MTDKPFAITNIDHVVIRADDISTMLAFYRDVLRCPVERVVEDMGLYQLRAGTALIDLIDSRGTLGKKGGPPPARTAHNMDHLCLRIDPWDADTINAYLRTFDIEPEPVAERNGAEGIGPSIYFYDPEGNMLELKGPPTAQRT